MRAAQALSISILLIAPVAAGEQPPDYAVSVTGILYEIDCEKVVYRKVGRIEIPAPAPAIRKRADQPKPNKTRARPAPERPVFSDLASINGFLYGISDSHLYLINISKPEQSKRIGRHGLSAAYGMTAMGQSLLVNTAAGGVYQVDPKTARTHLLGRMGSYGASGDIAVTKGKIYSSVKSRSGTETLVELNAETGKATKIGLFQTAKGKAFQHVFGLIERKGTLYALTSGGIILRVDPKTGRSVVLKRTGIQWWGATTYTRL